MAHEKGRADLDTVTRKPLAAELRLDADIERKRIADADYWRHHIGQTIDRALTLGALTKQGVSHEMGYADQSALSRWISGVERPLFDKLFAVDRFYDAWVIACGEANPRIEVTTTLKLRRLA